jgi:mannose-1-phosphate guanylyltransferase
MLDERFLMLNGDILTDIDLGEQLRQHEQTGARGTLALIGVEDPSAYGLVRRHPDGSVKEFLEKPSADQIDTNLISAGAYVLERDVLDGMAPKGSKISIERDVFPTLVGHGLYGYEASGAWLDIGTPDRYLQATYEILGGGLVTEVGRRLTEAGGVLGADGNSVHAPAVIGEGCTIAAGAVIGPHCVLGPGVTVGEGATIERSVVLEGAHIGAGSDVSGSIVAAGAHVGDGCQVRERAVLGAGVRVGAGNTLSGGIRIFPGVELTEGAIAF